MMFFSLRVPYKGCVKSKLVVYILLSPHQKNTNKNACTSVNFTCHTTKTTEYAVKATEYAHKTLNMNKKLDG
jgi:hypothetical protein